MKYFKIFKKNVKQPYKLHLSYLEVKRETEIRQLNKFEVAQIQASYPDIIKDNFLKAIILSEIALNEIGILI